MKKEIIVLKKDRTFVVMYHDNIVPVIGDFISINEKEIATVINRIFSPNSDKIVLIVEIK